MQAEPHKLYFAGAMIRFQALGKVLLISLLFIFGQNTTPSHPCPVHDSRQCFVVDCSSLPFRLSFRAYVVKRMWSSLRQLYEEGGPCCPISQKWHDCIHSEHTDAPYHEALSILEDGKSCGGRTCVDDIVNLAKQAVGGVYTGFPGPMCSPYCKANACMITAEGYTFTEKSDGIRVIVISIGVEQFPQWTDGSGAVVGLLDALRLESARHNLAASSSGDEVVAINGATYQMRAVSDGLYCLVSAVNPPGPSLSFHRTLAPRSFAYMMDRSMDATYLCMESRPVSPYSFTVYDGELMRSFRDPAECAVADSSERLLVGLFDMFAYKRRNDLHPVLLTRQPMSTRYAALKEAVTTDFHHPSTEKCACVWFAKEMWPVARLRECLLLIEYYDGAYWFNGPHGKTKNDGFVFTPEQFDVCGGASRTQLKWKWRPLLSVDWLVAPSLKFPGEFDVWVYFRKKNYNFRDDSAGHWKCNRTMKLLNPHGLKFPPGQRVVAESVYVDKDGLWSIERIRSDRTEANSIVTIISVFQSLAENLTLSSLCDSLGLTDVETQRRCAALEAPRGCASMTTAVGKAQASVKLLLRAVATSDGGHKLGVAWCTNRGNPDYKNSIPCTLCEVKDCICGYSAPLVSTLEDHFYMQLGNAGGSFSWSDFLVDAFFDGKLGRWVITGQTPNGRNHECHFDQILGHLHWLLRQGGGAAARAHHQIGKPASVMSMCEETRLTNAHYAEKAKQLSWSSNDTRSVLRRFNNWVKSMVVHDGQSLLRKLLPTVQRLQILDICCGRGGDLHKWKALKPAFLYMTDASYECVAEAAARYSVGKGMSTKIPLSKNDPGFPARFAVYDAFDPSSGLRSDLLLINKQRRAQFHLASCQLSMHYGCFSEERMTCFLTTIAQSLCHHGLFIGTTVDDRQLMQRFRKDGPVFGNRHYNVRFPLSTVERLQDAAAWNSFGLQYFASVENAVTELPEYVVPWSTFVELSSRLGLHLVHESNFAEYFNLHKDTALGKEMMRSVVGKRNREGADELQLEPDVLEAVSIYRVFLLEKV